MNDSVADIADDPRLFAIGPFVESAPAQRTIEEAFNDFHALNPWVYDALVWIARDMRNRGHRRIGIGMCFEVLRWQWKRRLDHDQTGGFRLNNNLRSRYARLIMDCEPDLADVFETRELRAA